MWLKIGTLLQLYSNIYLLTAFTQYIFICVSNKKIRIENKTML